jgi:hypothetical protein
VRQLAFGAAVVLVLVVVLLLFGAVVWSDGGPVTAGHHD